jgi:glycosyltransferase involved in cell wall biosynthesis
MTRKRSIGYKRNKAVQAAKYDICVNMDDDDVYPETSFRRRVSWLMAYPEVKVAGCTMIAMYDLQQGISAVNTPPWGLVQSQRVSEASFCFQKSYALENPFPDTQSSEGEGFLGKACAEDSFLEIPPQHILVALNHGTNTSSRCIAGRAQTGCFWGWDKQFIVWLHGLVGVQIEETANI